MFQIFMLLEKMKWIVEGEKMTVPPMVNSAVWSIVKRNLIKGGVLQ